MWIPAGDVAAETLGIKMPRHFVPFRGFHQRLRRVGVWRIDPDGVCGDMALAAFFGTDKLASAGMRSGPQPEPIQAERFKLLLVLG